MVSGNMKIRNLVVSVRHAFDYRCIDSILDHKPFEGCTGNQGLSDDYMPPCCRQAIRPDSDLDAMRVHWTIVTAAHIIFASPNKFYRRAAETFRNHSRFPLHV